MFVSAGAEGSRGTEDPGLQNPRPPAATWPRPLRGVPLRLWKTLVPGVAMFNTPGSFENKYIKLSLIKIKQQVGRE